jgi:tetratricopeptide (TPR) repeat protein
MGTLSIGDRKDMKKWPWIIFGFALLFSMVPSSSGMEQEGLPALVKRVESSIVAILTYNEEGKILGQGSGFFVNARGDVVTNYHVLHGAVRAEIRTTDEKEYSVKLVLAEDREGDLIQVSVDIPKETVHPLPVMSALPEVGERIIVVGTPLGLEKTVSDGIVSAIREVPKMGKIIQITAPISQGSSGSPVINMKGEVVGVVSFFVMLGQNLNFTIPGERVAELKEGVGVALTDREESRMRDWLGSAEGLYATGLRYIGLENFERALLYFVETVKRNPNNSDAYFQIGYCKAKLGSYEDAIGAYRQAIRIKPRDGDAHNNLCAAYGRVGRHEEAIESCRRAIQLRPELAEAYNNLAWSYYKQNRYAEAVESCKQAIRLNPDFAMAHYNLGNSYSALKSYERAIESYKQAIRIKFDYAEGHLNMGAAYNQMGRFEEAIASYKEAIKIKPHLAEAHLNLGMTHLKLGDRGSALEEYKVLKDLDKDQANKLFNLIYE